MKLLLLLAFIGLAASAKLPSVFQAKTPREITYQYDTQIATGIEEVSDTFSTLRMRFNVQMRTDGVVDSETDAERWYVVFKTVSFRQRNNATDKLPKEFLPMEEFKNLDKPELWFQIERTLKKPFGVFLRSKNLLITKVLFDEEDPFWSVNIKKGFLSLLQVNTMPRDIEADSLRSGQWTNEIDEMTVADVCKTYYSTKKIDYHEVDAQVYQVDKAIDFNKCQNPIDGTWGLSGIWNGMLHVRMLPGEEDRSLVHVNNMAKYIMDMGVDTRTPTVRKVSARTVHMMVPYRDSTHGSERIITLQKLNQINSQSLEESTPVDLTGLKERKEGIRLIFPRESNDVDREALKSHVIALFRKLFRGSEKIDMEAYEGILRILRFHLKTEEDLASIAEQLATTAEKEHLKVFLLDLCPQVGSRGSVKFLMEIVKMLTKKNTPKNFVKSASLTVYDISVIFSKIQLMGKVEVKMLQTVFDVVNDESFSNKLMNPERMPIFSTAWLSMGAMVNVYYGRQGGVEPYLSPVLEDPTLVGRYRYDEPTIRPPLAEKSENFRRQFISAVINNIDRNDFNRNLALKVTKNCGLFELYEALAPIIRKRDTAKVTDRVQAIYATQNMLRYDTQIRIMKIDVRRTISEEDRHIQEDSQLKRRFESIVSQIQADLLACFRNVREDPEVRIACYRVLMQCQILKQTVLNMLIQSILTEPTQQVYSYCIHHMSQISENPLPRYTRVSQTVRSVLSMLKRRTPFDLTYSRVFHGKLWDELLEIGLTIETDMIMSDKSFTPRWAHIRIEHQSMGQNMPLIEIGLRTQGLQGLLEKVLGPRGLVSKAGGLLPLLKRATRSLDPAMLDSDLLQVLPRILEEAPNMDLTVALMGYDIVYIKNTREIVDSVKRLEAQSIWRSLTSIGKLLNPFGTLFTISNNFELPTPGGIILDINCLMSVEFSPRIVPVYKVEEDKMMLKVDIYPPMTVNSFKRIGSNMHVLNHYHQWLATLNANDGVFYTFVVFLDRTDPNHIIFDFNLMAPSSKVPLVMFSNSAKSTISECHISGSSLSYSTKDEVVKHRSVADQTLMDYSPVFSNILAPFGYKVQIQGKYYSKRHLYEAPCSLFMGPSQYTVYMVPTLDSEASARAYFIKARFQIVYPSEESKKIPQIKMTINNVHLDPETVRQKLVEATFSPKETTTDKISFDFSLRWFLNLPSSYDTSGYQLKATGEIDLPDDLKMKPRSLPLRPEEWFVDRALSMTLKIRGDEGEIATIEVTKSTNPELKKLLVDSDLSESKLKQMFPRMVACLNESKESIVEEPLNANPLYTPSCIRLFKKFNKLSQTKIEIKRKVDWFMSCKSSPMLDRINQIFEDYLNDYLVLSEIPETTENKVTIVSRPSPIDLRVQHLNITYPNRKNIWRSIQLPTQPFFWAGIDPLMTSIQDYVKGGASKCSLLNSHVRTFDNVVYSIPKSLFSSITENKCPLLLAKDCSENKEFQVLSHIKDGKKYITIQFRTERRPFTVELSKPINSAEPQANVKVNGANLEHSVEPKEEVGILRRTVNTEKGPVTIVITKHHYADSIMYKVESIQQKVSVLIGGPKLRKVEIRVSPFYHNKVCGLCGDYNSEKFREFKAPNYHQEMSSPGKMVKQYVLPVSDSCKMGQESQIDPENKEYLPNKIWYTSMDLPSRRPSCQIVDNTRMKTFKHAEFETLSPALRQIIRDTDCALKLAVAKIDGLDIRVYLLASQSKVLIQVGSFTQYLSTSSPTSSERSSNSLPSGLSLSVEKSQYTAKCEISKGEKRVTVTTVRNPMEKKIVIKATQISESEEAVCELSHPSQIETEGSQVYEVLKKFTNSDVSSVCRDQLKKKINQCQITGSSVLPYYRSRDYNRWQAAFLNDDIETRLAASETPIVLSVDKIGEDSEIAHSVQLIYSKEGDKLMRQVLVKKNRQTLVKVIVSKVGSTRVTYVKESAETTIDATSAKVTIPIDGDFVLKVSKDSIQVSHKTNLYEVEVLLNSERPEISITRPYAHPSFTACGLCQANKLEDAQSYRTNPQAVLTSVMESCLPASDSSETKILTEEEIGKIKRFIKEMNESQNRVADF